MELRKSSFRTCYCPYQLYLQGFMSNDISWELNQDYNEIMMGEELKRKSANIP